MKARNGAALTPSNPIPPDCHSITPQMLPLVDLTPEEIEHIVRETPGGARNIQDIYPLAPLQEGMLFHHLVGGKRDAYVNQALLEFESRAQLDAFAGALQWVIDRYDILRSAILWNTLSRSVQVVCRRAVLAVEVLDLDRNRDLLAQLEERVRLETVRLDPQRAPLMRLQVVSDPRSTHSYAILQLHHLICDDQSWQTMFSEITSYLKGHAQTVPEPKQYRSHVARILTQARAREAERFFRARIGGVTEPTAPFGILNVHGDGSQLDEHSEALDITLVQQLRLQARRHRVSVATLFHLAWGLVVSHTSGQTDVVYGTVLFGRLQMGQDARRSVGMFLNTLPLRLRLEDITVENLVRRTQQGLMDLFSVEQASLSVAQRCSGITGSAPLFTTILNYRHGARRTDGKLDTADGMRVLLRQASTNYPITLSVDDSAEELVLTAQTDRRIDSRRMVGYMATATRSLVEAMEKAPQTLALSLPILAERERRRIIVQFNATGADYPRQKLIHQLFEEQVQRTPRAVAVVHERQSLTYAQLNGRANQLARYLVRKGITPDQLVAICTERGLEMLVGLLGILKAGAAYVPLDPTYPHERLAYMLSDASPRILLTQARLAEHLPSSTAEVITLDKDWSRISEHRADNLDSEELAHRPHHLAYVIYTSGSTGKPKGVMIEQAALVNCLCALQRQLALTASDCLLAATTVSFDIAALELYLPLLQGARLVVAGREVAHDARLLQQAIDEHAVTVLQATPTSWQMLLGDGWVGRSGLKALCGGEALTTDLSRRLLSRVDALWNLYGPTETTIWSCSQQIERRPERIGLVEPIGRPISNTSIYILNTQRQPVPIGVTGEIYIAGHGVARGYLNRPELTVERFVDDPFSSDPQARMYRTGDLGCYRADGTIEYLGRSDTQVKIRGFRIELGEIETQLAQHPQVKDAVALAREDLPGEKRLVAYVITRDGSTSEPESLRAHLKLALPDHMVPSAFMILESFPLTPNGKLDRRALPPPEAGAYVQRPFEAPQGDAEETLAEIWQSLLHIERVGRHDNFFELGGHSLLGMRLMERLQRLGIQAPITIAFQYPTIRQMAQFTQRLLSEDWKPLDSRPLELESGTL
jgi:amino acid adenylation domain-containing protein